MNFAGMIQDWLIAATLMSCAVSMAGLIVAIAGQRSQMATQIMMEYSDRFRIMLQEMPAAIRTARHSLTVPESTPDLTYSALTVFYVLLELHFLRRKRYLPLEIWNLWSPSVEAVIGSPLFVREWQAVRPDFIAQDSFCRFIDSLQK